MTAQIVLTPGRTDGRGRAWPEAYTLQINGRIKLILDEQTCLDLAAVDWHHGADLCKAATSSHRTPNARPAAPVPAPVVYAPAPAPAPVAVRSPVPGSSALDQVFGAAEIPPVPHNRSGIQRFQDWLLTNAPEAAQDPRVANCTDKGTLINLCKVLRSELTASK